MKDSIFRTPVGEMRVLEILLYSDGPKLFTCEDRKGRKFLAILVDETETADRWFFVPVDDDRLNRVRAGEIGLRVCVQKPENGWIWDVVIPLDGSRGNARLRCAGALQEHELPGPAATLPPLPQAEGAKNSA